MWHILHCIMLYKCTQGQTLRGGHTNVFPTHVGVGYSYMYVARAQLCRLSIRDKLTYSKAYIHAISENLPGFSETLLTLNPDGSLR